MGPQIILDEYNSTALQSPTKSMLHRRRSSSAASRCIRRIGGVSAAGHLACSLPRSARLPCCLLPRNNSCPATVATQQLRLLYSSASFPFARWALPFPMDKRKHTVFLLSFRNNNRNCATQSSAVTQQRSSRSNVTLLSSATINSLCRKDNRRNDDGNDNRRNDDATTTVATTKQPRCCCHAARQLCSTVLFDSSARQFHAGKFLLLRLHSFCYSARVLCDNQPNLSRRQVVLWTADGLCLHDSHTPSQHGQAKLLL
jgi:hypothetical protein